VFIAEHYSLLWELIRVPPGWDNHKATPSFFTVGNTVLSKVSCLQSNKVGEKQGPPKYISDGGRRGKRGEVMGEEGGCKWGQIFIPKESPTTQNIT